MEVDEIPMIQRINLNHIENNKILISKDVDKKIRNGANYRILIIQSNSLKTIDKLNVKIFTNLFVFIIEVNDYSTNPVILNKIQHKFSESAHRPLIVQFSIANNENIKIFYTNNQHEDFKDLNLNINDAFPSFYMKLSSNLNIDELCDPLSMRFLRLFEFSSDQIKQIILRYAASFSQNHFIAALDLPFNYQHEKISAESKELMSSSFNDNESVLKSFVAANNIEVVNFIMQFFGNVLKDLPHEHQLSIVNSANDEILYAILKLTNFPLPSTLLSSHDKLNESIAIRKSFHAAIEEGDFDKVKELEENFEFSKVAYNLDNQSALMTALKAKQFEIFSYLRSENFQAGYNEDIDGHIEKLEDSEKLKITEFNIDNGIEANDKAILLLSAKSSLHNHQINQKNAVKYHKNIKKFYRDLYKIPDAAILIEIASKCPDLQIIFDFNNESINDVDPRVEKGTLGLADSEYNVIFIGACDDSEAKCTLIHEIAHYVMMMVFKNNFKPYCGDTNDEYAEIVEKYREMYFGCDVDDLCNGIISVVFNEYDESYYELELIVRPVQIMAKYDNDMEYLNKLKEDYNDLFDFYENLIETELKPASLKMDEWINVRKLNKVIDLLPQIEKSGLKLDSYEKIDLNNNHIIIKSNVPTLSLVTLYQQLKNEQKELIEVKNIFITPEILDINEIYKDLCKLLKEKSPIKENRERSKEIHKKKIENGSNGQSSIEQDDPMDGSTTFSSTSLSHEKLKVIVDCTISSESNKLMDLISVNKKIQFIFIISNDKHEMFNENLTAQNIKSFTTEMTHEFKDLTNDSQKFLLETCVNFQGNNVRLIDLISKPNDDIQSTILSAANIIDDILLNQLCDNSQITIKKKQNSMESEKNFNKLFNSRKFVKKSSTKVVKELTEDEYKMQKTFKKFIEEIKIEGTENYKVTEVKTTTKKLSSDEQLKDVKNEKFVIISDVAGSGKSWMLAKRAEELISKFNDRWTTLITLNNHIDDFKNHSSIIEFMNKVILKNHTSYERAIFNQLYKNGKIFILLDGFDEILPNCAEDVLQLIKTFESNSGNQMWITTRSYFDVDLKKELKLNTVYSLKNLEFDECVEYVRSKWVLKYEKNIENHLKYHAKAQTLLRLFRYFLSSVIGSPQLLQIIAESYSPEHNPSELTYISLYGFYKKFTEKKIEIWSGERGRFSKEASIRAQNGDVWTFDKIHQVFAMKHFYPSENKFSDLKFDQHGLTIEEIIQCGILNKKSNSFVFPHETFAEYFAADFIIKQIKGERWKNDEFFTYFKDFMTVGKYHIVRSFINDANAEFSSKLERKIGDFAKKFLKKLGIVEIVNAFFHAVDENLEKNFDLLIKILSFAAEEKMKQVLRTKRNFDEFETVTVTLLSFAAEKSSAMFEKFLNFHIEKLAADEFEKLLIDDEVLAKFMSSEYDASFVKILFEKLEKSVKKKLLTGDYTDNKSSLSVLCSSRNFNNEKFELIWKELKDEIELSQYLLKTDKNDMTTLHYLALVDNEDVMRIIFSEIKNALAPEEMIKLMKVKSSHFRKRNFLQVTALNANFKVHNVLWNNLLTEEYVMSIINQKDEDKNGFLHTLVAFRDEKVIEMVFQRLKKLLTDDEYKKLLISKGYNDRNLMQKAADRSINVEAHRALWTIIYKFCQSSNQLNFIDILHEVDCWNSNIFHITTAWNEKCVFEFMIEFLENHNLASEIPKMLKHKNTCNQNILQAAVMRNISLEFHTYLWKILRKYLKPSKIIQMMKNETNDSNLLHVAVAFSPLMVVEFTWREIKKQLDNDDEFEEYLSIEGFRGKSLYQNSLDKNKNQNVSNWIARMLTQYDLAF